MMKSVADLDFNHVGFVTKRYIFMIMLGLHLDTISLYVMNMCDRGLNSHGLRNVKEIAVSCANRDDSEVDIFLTHGPSRYLR